MSQNEYVPTQYYQQYMYRQSHGDEEDSYPGPYRLQNWCDVFWKAVMGCFIMTALGVITVMIRSMYEVYRAETWLSVLNLWYLVGFGAVFTGHDDIFASAGYGLLEFMLSMVKFVQ